ncbi:hypothetical protein KI387_025862, partial [Taxus chinensis]
REIGRDDGGVCRENHGEGADFYSLGFESTGSGGGEGCDIVVPRARGVGGALLVNGGAMGECVGGVGVVGAPSAKPGETRGYFRCPSSFTPHM